MSSPRCTYKDKTMTKNVFYIILENVTFTVKHTVLYNFILVTLKIYIYSTYTIMAPQLPVVQGEAVSMVKIFHTLK